MKFSVIMPSLLADYPGAANNRDKKLIRAIESVLNQTYQDFVLYVISDGCDLTQFLINKWYHSYLQEKIVLARVERNGLFSNAPRNMGLDLATGDYITYLDSDDYYGKDHLQIINQAIIDQDWLAFNDWVWQDGKWKIRPMDLKQYGKCGTSNICHARRLGLRWIETGYGHDYHFIQQLLKYEKWEDIGPAEYYVARMTAESYDQSADNKL